MCAIFSVRQHICYSGALYAIVCPSVRLSITRASGVTNRPEKWVAWNCRKAMKTFVEKEPSGHSSCSFSGTATLGLWLDWTDIAYTIMVWNDSYFIAAGNFNFKRLTVMTARKPVEIKRRCQEQQHHCLHSLPFVLQTRTNANPAISWDGMSRLRFSATLNRGAPTGVTAARPRTNLVWQCHTVLINNF